MKPRNKGEKIKKAVKTLARLEATALQKGTPAGIIAAQLIKKNPKTVKKVTGYIKRAGMKPHPHPIGQALQVETIRDQKRDEITREMQEEATNSDADLNQAPQPEPEEVEDELLAREEEEAETSDEPDNFIDPVTLSLVFKTAQMGVQKVNNSRTAKGKPPIFTGEKLRAAVEKKLKGKSTGDPIADKAIEAALKEKGLGDAIAKGKEAYIDETKKDEIKKMLPQIILGLLVLVAVVYFAAKKSDK